MVNQILQNKSSRLTFEYVLLVGIMDADEVDRIASSPKAKNPHFLSSQIQIGRPLFSLSFVTVRFPAGIPHLQFGTSSETVLELGRLVPEKPVACVVSATKKRQVAGVFPHFQCRRPLSELMSEIAGIPQLQTL